MTHGPGPKVPRAALALKETFTNLPSVIADRGMKAADTLGTVIGGGIVDPLDLALTKAILNAAGVTVGLDRMPNGEHLAVRTSEDGTRTVEIGAQTPRTHALLRGGDELIAKVSDPTAMLHAVHADVVDTLNKIDALEMAGNTEEATRLALGLGVDALATVVVGGYLVGKLGAGSVALQNMLKASFKTPVQIVQPWVFALNNQTYVRLAEVLRLKGLGQQGGVTGSINQYVQKLGLSAAAAQQQANGAAAAGAVSAAGAAAAELGGGELLKQGVYALGGLSVLGSALFGDVKVHINSAIPYKQFNAHKDSWNVTFEFPGGVSFSAWVKPNDFRNYFALDKTLLHTGDYSMIYGRLQNGQPGLADLFRYSLLAVGTGWNVGSSNLALRNQIEVRLGNITLPLQAKLGNFKGGVVQWVKKMFDGFDGHFNVSPIYINAQAGPAVNMGAYNLREMTSFRWFGLNWPSKPHTQYVGKGFQNVFFNLTLNPGYFHPEWLGNHVPDFVINGLSNMVEGKSFIDKVDAKPLSESEWPNVRVIENGALREINSGETPSLDTNDRVVGVGKPAVWIEPNPQQKDFSLALERVLVQHPSHGLRRLGNDEMVIVDAEGQAWALPADRLNAVIQGTDPEKLGGWHAFLVRSKMPDLGAGRLIPSVSAD